MSRRGLSFVRKWTEANVDLDLAYFYADKRARVLAAACRLDAEAAQIGLQEIEDEIGDLEAAITRMLSTRTALT